jgi:secretion/DNA translocation related TadE-like protein
MGLIGALVSLGVAALVLGGAVVASHRARSSADLGALAGAAAVLRGAPAAEACAAARAVVRENSGRLTNCTVADGSIQVVVAVRPSVPRLADALARARAGPPSAR